jgi:hypothetical protein
MTVHHPRSKACVYVHTRFLPYFHLFLDHAVFSGPEKQSSSSGAYPLKALSSLNRPQNYFIITLIIIYLFRKADKKFILLETLFLKLYAFLSFIFLQNKYCVSIFEPFFCPNLFFFYIMCFKVFFERSLRYNLIFLKNKCLTPFFWKVIYAGNPFLYGV